MSHTQKVHGEHVLWETAFGTMEQAILGTVASSMGVPAVPLWFPIQHPVNMPVKAEEDASSYLSPYYPHGGAPQSFWLLASDFGQA